MRLVLFPRAAEHEGGQKGLKCGEQFDPVHTDLKAPLDRQSSISWHAHIQSHLSPSKKKKPKSDLSSKINIDRHLKVT